MDDLGSCLLFFLLLITAIQCKEMNGWPMDASGTTQTNWTGTWHGVIEAYPETETGGGWDVELEIGAYPTTDHSCTTWRSIMTANGTVQTTKDYRFCRERGAEDLYIDEGGGVRIAAQWINGVLVSPFKYKGVFAVSSMRIRGDVLEEEILITDDNPAIENVVVSVRAHSIHLMRMRRKSVSSAASNYFSSCVVFYIGALFFYKY